MRSRFDEQLALLNKELIQMGALCEEAIACSAKALTGERSLAQRVSSLEVEIDQKERDIESLCLKLLLRQQPVAHDLRQISAALKMITDMERIGDQADDIAEIVLSLDGRISENFGHIQEMAQTATEMVTGSVDAYVKRDVDLARAVMVRDDELDEAFLYLKSSLIGLIAREAEEGEYALDLLMIAKYFERIGDHAVNIAEWVEFAATGTHRGVTRP